MTRKNNYNFNALDSLTLSGYNIVLAFYLDYDKIISMLRLYVNIPEYIVSMYKGSKGQINYFNINDITYILVKTIKDDNLDILGMIGKNIINDRTNQSVLVIIDPSVSTIHTSLYIKNILQGLYSFDELKSVEPINIKMDFYISYMTPKEVQIMIEENKIMYEIRDLVNSPVNKLNSRDYESYIRQHLGSNIKMDVLNKKELEEQKLGLILAVNKGSKEEPKVIILDYAPENAINNENPICLVGKGVMFDTGGLDLKPGPMGEMKTDMVGSAIVYGVLKSLALKKCDKRVVGLLLVVQNDIGSSATHPGDVITSYSGKTVEITDTDAEGRLILADGIAYCKNYNPTFIIDIGSLTGQICHIFDNLATGFMTNHKKIKETFEKNSQTEREYVWELPLWPEFIKKTKSNIADYSNYSYSKADSIMCGTFLHEFLYNPTIPWLHLDIGGVSYNEEATCSRNSGATGAMFNTLSNFLMDIQIKDIYLELFRRLPALNA